MKIRRPRMLRNAYKLAMPLFSAAMAIALAIISWNTLQAARKAGRVIGEDSPVVQSQKARLDEFTKQLDGGK